MSRARRAVAALRRRVVQAVGFDRRVGFAVGPTWVAVAVPDSQWVDLLCRLGAVRLRRGRAPVRVDRLDLPHGRVFAVSPPPPPPEGSPAPVHQLERERLVPDLVDSIETAFLSRSNLPVLHAALACVRPSVGHRSVGVMVSGASRSGKSTLAVALGSLDRVSIATDELVVLLGGRAAQGFARPVHRRVAVESTTPRGWTSVQGWSHDLLVPPRRRVSPCEIDLVVFPTRRAEERQVRLVPVSFGSRVRRLIENSFNLAELGLDAVERVVEMSRRVVAVEVHYSEAADVAERILELVDGQLPPALPVVRHQPANRAGRLWMSTESAVAVSGDGLRAVSLVLDPVESVDRSPASVAAIVAAVDDAFGGEW